MGGQGSVTFEQVDNVTVARVRPSELTSGLTDAISAQLAQMTGAGGSARLVVDLSSVMLIDSVALGGLVVLLRRTKQSKGRLALVGLGGQALKVFQVTGLVKIFDMYNDVASAVAEVKKPL